MINKKNWSETKGKFDAWWKRENTGRPLLYLRGKKGELSGGYTEPDTPEKFHLDVENLILKFRDYCNNHEFLGEAFPGFDINIGPGSMALYLGGEPDFSWDTVWFKECIDDIEEQGDLYFDENNYWWKRHLDLINKAKELSKDEFYINIPDIIENIDILAAMRGPQNLLYDMMDYPETVKKFVNQIDDMYFKYYDPIYEIVKDVDGGSSYTSFCIWGNGKTAKVQCDFNALISPDQFREFVIPSLKKQCANLDNSLFHLDGPDAVKHIDALMEIEELDALQWTYGACQPDGGDEMWYPLYDKVFEAGKALWTHIGDGTPDIWFEKSDKLVRRYGTKGLYLIYPDMDISTATEFLEKANDEWE